MTIINLKDFYYWYTQDEFIEVTDEVEEELLADKRYQKTHERTLRRNKVLSLDVEDGTETSAISFYTDSPEAILGKMEGHCRLCRALNSLPEIQGRRIEAHYILGMSKAEIARAEGVSEKNVRQSIERGLKNMRQYYLNNF